jgi:hypothetical protein
MAKFGLVTIISIVINLFLTFWLVNQYMSDVYFQSYVNGTIGQYYPFIVLTVGVGGGSGLGYLFLKRKHADTGLVSKIQKSKSFKPPGPLASTPSTATSKQTLPTGPPPTPVSKHTAYAVPPLPKSSTPSGSRTMPGSTWASATTSKSSLDSILSSKQDSTARPSIAGVQVPRSEPTESTSPSFTSVTETQPPQPLRSIGETPKQSSWNPSERRPESGPLFQKPGLDIAKDDSTFTGFASQPQGPQTPPIPPKWSPPEDKTGTSQWPEGSVKSIPPMPTKWSPSSQPASPQERTAPQQGFPRPGPMPPRGPTSTSQGGPRPFIVQGPGSPSRPGEQRPMGAPRPIAAPQQFRPDPNRPPPGMGAQVRPQPSPRPAAPIGGPMPQPWTPTMQNQERREPSSLGSTNQQGSSPAVTGTSSSRETVDQKIAPEGGGGEMDWDTALDTILKTLRKDRVGDTK